MRKISLVLALILVLTCGVFVACGDDASESSAPATSETSKPAKEESSEAPADDSSEAPADDSSAPADESSAAPAPEAGSENIAAGKTYTASEQFKQGGADVQWGWDDNAPYAYPDEEGKTLTDGAKPADGSDYQAAEWAGWTGVHPDYAKDGYVWVTIDLGESKNIAKVNVWGGTQMLGNGIAACQGLEALVSEDGTNWTSIGTATPANDANTLNECTTIAGAGTGRYVQVRIVTGNWAFFSEIEVFEAAAAE